MGKEVMVAWGPWNTQNLVQGMAALPCLQGQAHPAVCGLEPAVQPMPRDWAQGQRSLPMDQVLMGQAGGWGGGGGG